MTQDYDNLTLGDLVTARYLKNKGDIFSRSLNVLYRAQYRSDLNAQDVGVVNDGLDDTSQVFEITAKN